jgi:hypothetical protein
VQVGVGKDRTRATRCEVACIGRATVGWAERVPASGYGWAGDGGRWAVDGRWWAVTKR